MVQRVSGTALNFPRQILIGQEHTTLISQWYGETVGFWDEETLITWTKNVQGWWMSHALPEFSIDFEAIEVYTKDDEGNLHLDVTMYDPTAFTSPLRLEVEYTWRGDCQFALKLMPNTDRPHLIRCSMNSYRNRLTPNVTTIMMPNFVQGPNCSGNNT